MTFNRPRFCKSILRKFAFLATDNKLPRKSGVASYEFFDRYEDADVMVYIFVAHPELPHIELTVKGAKPGSYHYASSGNKSAAALQRRYYAAVGDSPKSFVDTAALYEEFVDLQAAAVRSAMAVIGRNSRRFGPEWKKGR